MASRQDLVHLPVCESCSPSIVTDAAAPELTPHQHTEALSQERRNSSSEAHPSEA